MIESCYDVWCGDRFECIGKGENEYSVPELADCSLNMTDIGSRLCSYGCNEDTGLCFDSEDITDIEEAEDIFGWIKGEAENTFSSFILVGFSLSITGMGIIWSAKETKSWQLGLGVGLLISVIFFYIGWLDTWMIMLWGLIVALMISKTFIEQFKGK